MDSIKLGLKENWRQFALLVVINAFVGGMVGMERSIFPEFATTQFGVTSNTAILSFILAFGLTKAITNYFTGRLSNSFGRKRLLIVGWLLAMPIPFILIHAPSWNWIVFANCLLGISQGLSWSSTVIMKIDLVGEKQRGLAMGLNEFAGYLSVGLISYFTGYVVYTYGIFPYPFYIGFVLVFGGFLLTLLTKDTIQFVKKESKNSEKPILRSVFVETSLKNKNLSAITQAGLVNNLNDGMIWGLLPIYLSLLEYKADSIGIIAGIYPMVWGFGQLFTGKAADIYPKKTMLFLGMLLQAMVILLLPSVEDFFLLIGLTTVLGIGTAMVYPTFLAAIAEFTHPEQRAESLGVFRFWRDFGYAIGALISGVTADILGIKAAILLVGALTALSAFVIWQRMSHS
ncbi:MAG: MFS transporter [Acidobacteriota bacterium]|nr:MFS transporter [Pyrinomonadaceae bacterium]MDW8303806.1 MFS transporter [Acidobacteriota bacterium]